MPSSQTPLHVLHLSDAGLPYAVGGRDTFMHYLALDLQKKGILVDCTYHQHSELLEPLGKYSHDSVDYHVLPEITHRVTRTARARRIAPSLPGFEILLRSLKPDILHLHDCSYTCGISHLQAARRLGIRSVLTYHTPGQSCQQTELLRGARIPCDGRLLVGRCGQCRLSSAGMPRAMAGVLGRITLPGIDPDSESRMSRALTSRPITREFIAGWNDLIANTDLVHCHAEWVEAMLRSNRVEPSKLRMYRTGLPKPVETLPRIPGDKLRVAFLGRCDRVKGIETLIAAVRCLPADAPIVVELIGPYFDRPYGQGLLAPTIGDPRFRPPRIVKQDELSALWAATDILTVPSVWLETGPLVILEAFAGGVPVVGSRLGGIAELVLDGVDGLLHVPGDAESLSNCLRRLLDEKGLLVKLRNGIRPPRTLGDLADELIPEYRRLANQDT